MFPESAGKTYKDKNKVACERSNQDLISSFEEIPTEISRQQKLQVSHGGLCHPVRGGIDTCNQTQCQDPACCGEGLNREAKHLCLIPDLLAQSEDLIYVLCPYCKHRISGVWNYQVSISDCSYGNGRARSSTSVSLLPQLLFNAPIH